MIELPEKFKERMKEILGEADYEEYVKSYDSERLYGLRVNTGKISVEEFLKIAPFSLKPIPWIENGFYYEKEDQPAKHPYYFAGLYYIQEPSAMTPAHTLPVKKGERVLDLCAAPGGKATELGVKTGREGFLIANDISASRAKGLLKNIELFGIGHVLVSSEYPQKLTEYFQGYFDKILIDAPCSGEGMFRKQPGMVKSWEQNGPEYFAQIQRDIVVQAAEMLKEGGMMLYSTCTFSPEENEGTVDWLLSQCPEFKILDIPAYEGFSEGIPAYGNGREELKKCVRIFPHRMNGEGHFVALLQKGSETGGLIEPKEAGRLDLKGVRLPEELEEFLSEVSAPMDAGRIEIKEGRVFYMPEGMPRLNGLRFLRSGLFMGELKKNRFEPSQAFAMYLKAEEYGKVLNLRADDKRTVKYLKGETIDTEDIIDQKAKGWHLVCVDGYPLGWGKLAQGVLKNKYFSGWRWQS